MESSRVSVAQKRKLSGPSTWPRVLKAAPKREPTRASLSGRLTERQQLALALEESRKDSLPQQQEQQGAEHALQRCDSGEQSSSLRCCDDEIAANRSSSSKRRLKQQHARTEDGMPSSPCRTNSHEQASTSGRAGAIASTGAAKPAGTLFSSSMSSGTSKQSASTAFKVPSSRSRHGASAAPCPPISVPDAESDPSPSDPASPISQADRLPAPANVSSSSTSELTGLHASDILPPMLQAGDLPTESAALSNDPQNDYGPSERLGSLTPSVSHSASPSSLEVHHPCKKLRRDSTSLAGTAAAAFPFPAARPAAGFKNPIRVKLGAAEGPAKRSPDTPVASPSARQQTAPSLQSAKRLAEPCATGGAPGPAAKRPKVEQRDSLPHPAPGRSSSFRKPRSKSVKAKLPAGGRNQAARPSIPPSVFEEPAGEPTQLPQPKTQQQPLAPVSCILKACSQLVDLDRRACGAATTCLPRSSAFLELKQDEEDLSESDDEGSAAVASVKEPAPLPPLAYFEDSACDTSLASKLTRLRLADSQAGGKPALHCSQESSPALLNEVGGKLSKAHHACLQSAGCQAAQLPGVTDCCSFLYQPLRAAAASWPTEMKTFCTSSAAAACKTASRDAGGVMAGLPDQHAADVLKAVQTWIER